MACHAELARLETEVEFYLALPALIEQHGPEEVKASMKSFLTRGQINECFKQLQARKTHILWIHCTFSAGALTGLAILITDQSLNEVDRKSWVLLGGHACIDSIVNGFLQVHCAPGCKIAAATSTDRQLQVLEAELPAVRRYVGEQPIDLSSGGVHLYAELLGLPVLAESRRDAGDGDINAFEARMRAGESPTCRTPLPPEAPAEDHCEAAVLALGWARERFIAPPKAARFVTMALHALSVFLVGSLVRAVALWMAIS